MASLESYNFRYNLNCGVIRLGVTNAAGKQTTEFDFDAYANMTGYVYSYNASTMTETITKSGSTFATRINAKNSDGSWTVTINCAPLNFSSKKKWTKASNGNWSTSDV